MYRMLNGLCGIVRAAIHVGGLLYLIYLCAAMHIDDEASPLVSKDELNGELLMGEKMEQLRAQILADYQSHPRLYDKEDIKRVLRASWPDSDWPLRRYLIFTDGIMEDAFKLMKDNFQWRAETRLNNLTARDWPCEFFEMTQLTLTHTRRGRPLITYDFNRHGNFPGIKSALYLFLYWNMDLVDRAVANAPHPEEGWSAAFNMHEVKMANLDTGGIGAMKPTVERFPAGIKTAYMVGVNRLIRSFIVPIFRSLPGQTNQLMEFVDFHEMYRYARKRDLPRYLDGKLPAQTTGIPLTVNAAEECVPIKEMASARGWLPEDVKRFLDHMNDVKRRLD